MDINILKRILVFLGFSVLFVVDCRTLQGISGLAEKNIEGDLLNSRHLQRALHKRRNKRQMDFGLSTANQNVRKAPHRSTHNELTEKGLVAMKKGKKFKKTQEREAKRRHAEETKRKNAQLMDMSFAKQPSRQIERQEVVARDSQNVRSVADFDPLTQQAVEDVAQRRSAETVSQLQKQRQSPVGAAEDAAEKRSTQLLKSFSRGDRNIGQNRKRTLDNNDEDAGQSRVDRSGNDEANRQMAQLITHSVSDLAKRKALDRELREKGRPAPRRTKDVGEADPGASDASISGEFCFILNKDRLRGPGVQKGLQVWSHWMRHTCRPHTQWVGPYVLQTPCLSSTRGGTP